MSETRSTIFGVPFRYSLEAPEDEILIHPLALSSLINGMPSPDNVVAIYKHADGSMHVGADTK